MNIKKVKDIKGGERRTSEWEKIFANNISDKERTSRIYKELRQPNLKMGQGSE